MAGLATYFEPICGRAWIPNGACYFFPARRQRQPATLALADDADVGRVHLWQWPRRVDGPYSIGDEAAVVVGLTVENSARHDSRVCRSGRSFVTGVADRPH